MADKIEIAIIDDDEGARVSVSSLLEAAGYAPKAFAAAGLFLDRFEPAFACAIVDIRMPDMNGLELQQILKLRGIKLPIIFVTGRADVAHAVQALLAGAVDFIEKPFTSEFLLESLMRAVKIGQQSSSDFAKMTGAKTILARLTPREQKVMDLLINGRSTKIAAFELGISPRTVETHRARIMDKMSARSICDVVRVAMAAG